MSKIKSKNLFPSVYVLIGGIIIIILLTTYIFQSKLLTNNANLRAGNSDGGQNNKVNRNNCLSDDCLAVQDLDYPVGELPTEVNSALDEAINDEYKALSTYEKIIEMFGQVRPFSMIKGAEEQHVASLKSLYDKYGLKAPEKTWMNTVSVPSTLRQACQIGVDAEIANAALYREKLLPAVSEYEDITLVFTNLMNASEQKHLPAFERCN